MPTKNARFLPKRTAVSGRIPTGTTGNESNFIQQGELAVNTADKKLYSFDGTNVFEFGANSFLGLSGGTINGDFTVTGSSNLQQVSIEKYADFYSGATVPSAKVGRVYFDQNENALSYFPYTDNMDVTLNVGQESFIRIYNNTGVPILNGQAVSLCGDISGSPLVVLSSAVDVTGDTAVVSGIATHQIENDGFGFITNFGIVRDVNLSGFSNGETVYLSDVVPGGFIKLENLLNTSRASKIGRVISNGSLTGKLLVIIENESGNISGISRRQETIFTLENTSTGLFQFTGLSYTSTYFNVAPIKGWVVDNTTDVFVPTIRYINYSGATGLTSIYLSSNTGTYLLVNTASTLMMQSTNPTAEERRDNLYVGKITHPNYSAYTSVQHQLLSMLSPYQSTYDMFSSLKYIKQGLVCSANGGNLKINISSGKLFGLGINFPSNTKKPNELSFSATSPTTFRYRTQTGGTSVDTTDIDVSRYDVGGAITAIPGGAGVKRATNQRIYLFPGGEVRIGYGQNYYSTLSEAISAIQSETFIEYSNFSENAILIGILSVEKSATALNVTSDARFITTSKLGENIGGAAGISTSTLQNSYDNSTQPEILTDSTRGAVNFRVGSGSDLDNILTIQQNSGAINAVFRGTGYFSATTVNAEILTSGNTNLYDIFQPIGSDLNKTYVQGGLNTYTGGTVDLPTVNISAATLDNIAVSGNSTLGITSTNTLTVHGDLFVEGTSFTSHTENVFMSANTITLNYGEVNSGVTKGSAGILVDRGTATKYEFVFDESTDTFRVGETGTTQPVATREDSPISNGFAYWNSSQYRFDTSTSISATTFVSGGTELTSLMDARYVNVAGDTMTGTLNVPVLSATTISATTIVCASLPSPYFTWDM